MRQAFIKALVEEATKDEDIYLIVADIGFGLVNPFSEKFPDRFINVGVAEQNMIGVATGLALSGKKVFCYSIGNFPTLRCLEQIRNDVCYHKANVCIVAGNTGLAYGALGSSHHATEDIAIMRALPNMTVIAPADASETALATREIAKGIGACYLRLGRSEQNGQGVLKFQIGKAAIIMSGSDVAFISMGSMLYSVLQAADKLRSEGCYSLVVNMSTIKPLDIDIIKYLSGRVHAIITVEEHSIVGGLGSAIAEAIADNNLQVGLKRMGLRDAFCTEVGTQEELLKLNRLAVDDIVAEVKSAIR